VPLVVLTGMDDEALASQALQEGAQDYLIKGQIEARGLLRSLRYAVERKAMEEALFVEKERAQVTLNCIGDAVVCTDISGNITFLNAVAEKLTAWSRREAAGRPMAEVIRIKDAANHETIPNPMATAVRQEGTVHLPSNSILIRRDGFEIPVEDSAAPIYDREGQAAGAVIVFRGAGDGAGDGAADDSFGRARLSDRFAQWIAPERPDQPGDALARRHRNHIAILFLDLDGFKHINDSLGHQIGDKLLQSVAKRLADCVRDPDTVSRQGGDEFVVLLSELQQAEDAGVTARRMLQAVAALCAEHDVPCQIAMEAAMACGFGACYGCAVRIDGVWKRLCIEGPVVEAARVLA